MVIRPLSVDKTEMTIYCLGAKGESDKAREIRIRQYEDFFNTSGLATPDDTIAYEDCQVGNQATVVEWNQGYGRGLQVARQGADEYAEELGIEPLTSASGPFRMQDETVFHGSYAAWLGFLRSGLKADGLG